MPWEQCPTCFNKFKILANHFLCSPNCNPRSLSGFPKVSSDDSLKRSYSEFQTNAKLSSKVAKGNIDIFPSGKMDDNVRKLYKRLKSDLVSGFAKPSTYQIEIYISKVLEHKLSVQ